MSVDPVVNSNLDLIAQAKINDVLHRRLTARHQEADEFGKRGYTSWRPYVPEVVEAYREVARMKVRDLPLGKAPIRSRVLPALSEELRAQFETLSYYAVSKMYKSALIDLRNAAIVTAILSGPAGLRSEETVERALCLLDRVVRRGPTSYELNENSYFRAGDRRELLTLIGLTAKSLGRRQQVDELVALAVKPRLDGEPSPPPLPAWLVSLRGSVASCRLREARVKSTNRLGDFTDLTPKPS